MKTKGRSPGSGSAPFFVTKEKRLALPAYHPPAAPDQFDAPRQITRRVNAPPHRYARRVGRFRLIVAGSVGIDNWSLQIQISVTARHGGEARGGGSTPVFAHMKEIRREVGSDSVIVSLSLGKDSVACLILCSMVFDKIYCMVGEQIPGRRVDREYAAYLRKCFPKIQRINFYPHPRFLEKWNDGIFRRHTQYADPFLERGGDEPESDTYQYDYRAMKNHLAIECGLDPTNTYQAVGVKMSDSMNRRISLTRIGYIKHSEHTIYPVRDYTGRSVFELLKYKGIRLHPDYQHYGSSFDGMSAKYWVKASRSDPETWRRITHYFPMAKAYVYRDIFKREMNQNADH